MFTAKEAFGEGHRIKQVSLFGQDATPSYSTSSANPAGTI